MYSWGGNNGSNLNTVDIYDIGNRQSILTLQENGQDTLSFQAGSGLFLSSGRLGILGGNVGIGTSTPSDKLEITTTASGSGASTYDGLSINFTQGSDGDSADTNAGLNINITSSSSNADTLLGINIANITASASAVERGLQIGSGWDSNLFFNDTTSFIDVASGGTITFTGNTTLGDATSDTVTLTAKITGASGAALGFSNAAFTTCTALSTVAGMLTCDVDDVGGGGGAWTDGTNVVYLAVSADLVGIGTSTPVDKLQIDTSTSGSATFDGLAINFTQDDDADATDINSGLSIAITSSSSDADVVNGISITITGTSVSARERGISIGTGFDDDIYFASAEAKLRIQSGGQIDITDNFNGGNGSTGLPLGRFKEYFADANYGVWEAGGFVNIDGSFYQDQFTTVQLTQTQAPTAKSNMFGDDQRWGNIRGTACTVGQNNSTVSNFTGVGGFVELRLTTNSSACYFYMGYPMGAVTATTIAATSVPGILNAANKFVMYYKVKHDGATSTNRMIMIGADNYTAVNRGPVQAAIGASNTRGGIWFTNYTVTGTATNQASIGQWVGMAKKKTEVTHQATVTCGANSTIITNQYALMRIEARQTNDVQFFLDNNISNGINLEQCSTGITNTNAIPSFNLKPAVMVNNQSTAAQFSLFIDLFAFVQDDPRPAPGQEAPIVDNSPAPSPPPPDIIAGADLAEYYYFQDKTSVESGDVVVLGSYAGQAKKSENKYDRKLLGVVAEWPG